MKNDEFDEQQLRLECLKLISKQKDGRVYDLRDHIYYAEMLVRYILKGYPND